MLKTNNPALEAILDATLTGENRKLLLVGQRGMLNTCVRFNKNAIKDLENELLAARAHLKNVELAYALTMLGTNLDAQILESE